MNEGDQTLWYREWLQCAGLPGWQFSRKRPVLSQSSHGDILLLGSAMILPAVRQAIDKQLLPALASFNKRA